jgi:hypothetical protein
MFKSVTVAFLTIWRQSLLVLILAEWLRSIRLCP